MSKLILPMGEMPGVIRESVRAVLNAQHVRFANPMPLSGPPYFAYEGLGDSRTEALLRELGNNITQCLWSLDESLNNESAGGSPSPAGEERDGAGDSSTPPPPQPAPSRSGCTPSASDRLAVGSTLRALAANGTPNAETAEVLARVGVWLVETSLEEIAKAKAAKAA